MVHESVTLEGHLIDSDILRRVFDRVVEEGGAFEVVEFRVGKTNAEPSFVSLAVKAQDPQALDRILQELAYLGAATDLGDARFAPAEAEGSCRTSSTRLATSTPSCASRGSGTRRRTRRWTRPWSCDRGCPAASSRAW